jgi:pyrrolidone-carboxylate peptidase
VHFDPDVPYRVLITGFDPFGLETNLDQSNPSGLAVLALDGRVLPTARGEVQVQGVLIPVRFADFDLGLIESFLTPQLTDARLQLVLTISMGRDAFDLERFPGRRRSAAVADNLNVLTGADPEHPLIPALDGEPLAGPEFLEFSLPATAMTAVDAPFAVRDNRTVRTLERGELVAASLAELALQTAVAGSGGGYLSNEIAYRALLANRRSGAAVPMGHLHTPRVSGFEPQAEWQMVEQIRRLIVAAVESLPDR